jgi:hypothetical protein
MKHGETGFSLKEHHGGDRLATGKEKSVHGTQPFPAKCHSILNSSFPHPEPSVDLSSNGHFMVRVAVVNFPKRGVSLLFRLETVHPG